MSRVIVAHSPAAPSRASFTCQVPATGFATSATQKRRSAVPLLIWKRPSVGRNSENSPSSAGGENDLRKLFPRRDGSQDRFAASSVVAGELVPVSRVPRTDDRHALRPATMLTQQQQSACQKQWNPIPRWNCEKALA